MYPGGLTCTFGLISLLANKKACNWGRKGFNVGFYGSINFFCQTLCCILGGRGLNCLHGVSGRFLAVHCVTVRHLHCILRH